MKEQLKVIEAKIKSLKHFRHGSELTVDVDLKDLTEDNMNDVAGFFDIKTHQKAFSYLNKLKHKYNAK